MTETMGTGVIGSRIPAGDLPSADRGSVWRSVNVERACRETSQPSPGEQAVARRGADGGAHRGQGHRLHGQLAVPDLQTVLVAVWLGGNAYLLSKPFDPYPFILLNLAFSTQAAYAAPLILLAGNRSAQRDRLTLEHAASEADLEEKQNVRLLRGNTEILEHVVALEKQILQLEERIMAKLQAGG